jgi:hypothetical protein
VIDLTKPVFPYVDKDSWIEVVQSFRTVGTSSQHQIVAVLQCGLRLKILKAGFSVMDDALAYSQHLCTEAQRFMHYRNIVAVYELARFHLQQHDPISAESNTLGNWTVGFWKFSIVQVQ